MSVLLAACLALLARGEASARWSVAPVEAQVGEPVVWTLEVRAPAGSLVLLPDKDPALDPSWVELEPRRMARVERDGELVYDLSWKLCSLESGSRTPFAFEVPVEAPGGRVTLQPEAATLSVRPALGENEDAPRPPKGFLEPPAGAASRAWIAWTALGVLLAGSGAAWWIARQRRSAALAAARPPTALERLAALEQAFAAEERRARETVFALTQLVRERTDACLGCARAALPDEEWLAQVAAEPRLRPAAREAAARLLERAREIKYAQATPSRFLVLELVAEARTALSLQELAA